MKEINGKNLHFFLDLLGSNKNPNLIKIEYDGTHYFLGKDIMCRFNRIGLKHKILVFRCAEFDKDKLKTFYTFTSAYNYLMKNIFKES